MSQRMHPLKKWMEREGYACDYDRLAARLKHSPFAPTGESIRQIANGYRRPSWDLAFAIEAITEISAHTLRDERLYDTAEKAAS